MRNTYYHFCVFYALQMRFWQNTTFWKSEIFDIPKFEKPIFGKRKRWKMRNTYYYFCVFYTLQMHFWNMCNIEYMQIPIYVISVIYGICNISVNCF